MKSAQGRAEALAYWVVSDHFEELGRPPRLFHGGFGLLTVGNLRKPRWWALALAEQLGRDGVAVELHGDGAGSLVDAWAARHDDGSIDVLVWNGTLDQSKAAGSPLLSRRLRIRVEGRDVGSYDGTLARIDEEHSNITRAWNGKSDWPSETEWDALRGSDRLAEEPVEVTDRGEICFDLPMPGIARLRLRASEARTALRSML
jgi:xylan 1,4-beta-xylosidase